MRVSGILFTVLDTNHDVIEAWNRWYDLEHLPPNILIDGITTGRRYVATPPLHAGRVSASSVPGFTDGRGPNVTIYTISGDPSAVLTDMVEWRDRLQDAGRMFEPADAKTVRFGGTFNLEWCMADPGLKLSEDEVPHLGHTAIRVVVRQGLDEPEAQQVGRAATRVDGCHGVMGHSPDAVGISAGDGSPFGLDIYLLEGDAVSVVDACRSQAPYPDGTTVLLDGAFNVITPLRYDFAEEIRSSSLPATID